MNKRGQVYLLAAVIISVVIFGASVAKNTLEQEPLDDDFETLSSTFDLEAARVVNVLLTSNDLGDEDEEDGDILNEFTEFAFDFASYARSQNPDYELLALFGVADGSQKRLFIANYLSSEIKIYKTLEEDESPLGTITGCYEHTSARISLGGITLDGSGSDDALTFLTDCKKSNIRFSENENEIFICVIEKDEETEEETDRDCYEFRVSDKPQMLIVTGATEGQQRQVFVGGEGFVDPVANPDGGRSSE